MSDGDYYTRPFGEAFLPWRLALWHRHLVHKALSPDPLCPFQQPTFFYHSWPFPQLDEGLGHLHGILHSSLPLVHPLILHAVTCTLPGGGSAQLSPCGEIAALRSKLAGLGPGWDRPTSCCLTGFHPPAGSMVVRIRRRDQNQLKACTQSEALVD